MVSHTKESQPGPCFLGFFARGTAASIYFEVMYLSRYFVLRSIYQRVTSSNSLVYNLHRLLPHAQRSTSGLIQLLPYSRSLLP